MIISCSSEKAQIHSATGRCPITCIVGLLYTFRLETSTKQNQAPILSKKKHQSGFKMQQIYNTFFSIQTTYNQNRTYSTTPLPTGAANTLAGGGRNAEWQLTGLAESSLISEGGWSMQGIQGVFASQSPRRAATSRSSARARQLCLGAKQTAPQQLTTADL